MKTFTACVCVSALWASAVPAASPTTAPMLHPIKVTRSDPMLFQGPDVQSDGINKHRTLGKSSDGRLRAGLSSTLIKGHVQVVSAAVDEFRFILSGGQTFTSADGTKLEAGSGDAVFVPKGWKGRWDTNGHEQFYVIYEQGEEPTTAAISQPVLHPTMLRSNDPNALSTSDVKTHQMFKYRVIGKSSDGNFRAGLSSMHAKRSLAAPAMEVDEMLFLLEGAETFTSVDGTVTEGKAGDVLFMPKGWKGRYDTDGYTEIYVIYGPECMASNSC